MKKKPPLSSLALSALLTIGVSAQALAQSAADRAVEAAQQYAGTEITIVWEAGLQALDPLNFSGPKWKELTGIDVSVVEVPTAEMFTKILQEHRAGTGAYDALNVIPSWMPDLVRAGALEPLDPYVDEYGYREELQEIAPVYRDNQMTVDGTIYGFPDDGDVFVFYYRKDIFEENGLEPPTTWQEFAEICNQLTEKYAPDMYGGGDVPPEPLSAVPVPGALPGRGRQVLRCRDHGGDGQRRHRRQGADRDARGEQVHAARRRELGLRREPRGVPRRRHRDDDLVAALRPLGRGLRHRRGGAVLGPEVDRSPARSATPCRRAAIRSSRPASRSPSRASSANKEAAYLFIQWLNSKEISLQRVQLPYALRDPFRDSHFASEEYKSRWPDAPAYLETLQEGAVSGLLDLSILQTDRYEEALRQGLSRLWAGDDPQADPRRHRRAVGRDHRAGRRRRPARRPMPTGPASPTPIRTEPIGPRRPWPGVMPRPLLP